MQTNPGGPCGAPHRGAQTVRKALRGVFLVLLFALSICTGPDAARAEEARAGAGEPGALATPGAPGATPRPGAQGAPDASGGGASPQGAPLVIATLEWPPYIGTNLPDNGYVAKVIREALAPSGLTIRFDFMPWARAVTLLRSGEIMVAAPVYRNAARDKDCVFSAPFPGGPLVLLAMPGRGGRWKDLRELAGLRIGVTRGYGHTDAFDAADFLTKEQANDDVSNLRKLLAGRIDAFAADRYMVGHLLRGTPGLAPLPLAEFAPPLGEPTLHLCFSRWHQGNGQLRQAFDAGLEKLRNSGRLDELYGDIANQCAMPRADTR